MSFIRKQGKVKTIWLPVTTSTALTINNLVKFTAGLLVAVTTDASAAVIGVGKKAIVAADSDYATARLIPVEVPVEKHVVYEFDVNAGLLSTDLGTEYDLADAGTVNHAATTNLNVKVLKFISATKGQGFVKFNGSY